MSAVRIVCVGNRFAAGDDFGPRVYDCLAAQPLPERVAVMDGGLGGLGLLGFLEGAQRVVFVDAVAGFTKPGQLVLLDGDEVADQDDGAYDHQAGLPYLLRVMPAVLDSPPPAVTLVGHEGVADEGNVRRAASLALSLAAEAADAVRP